MYFAPVFFPKASATAQLLNTAAIFAVSFLMRPLSAALLGAYANRQGRRAALLCSLLGYLRRGESQASGHLDGEATGQ